VTYCNSVVRFKHANSTVDFSLNPIKISFIRISLATNLVTSELMATEKIFGPIVSLVKTDSYILNLRIIKILFLLYEDNLFN